MLTPPLATLLHMTKNRLSGVNLKMHVLVSLEMVVMTPGGQEEQQHFTMTFVFIQNSLLERRQVSKN